ncbi:TetR/AcrR family transcriptional regulator [Microbacterium mangrovi]|uniref:TetR/AcrR family transcriptional regulator n=1 Tax=Microbacterium mangrovi TaxID=1348253 RepID=UPI000689F372|nr:TetR/AcrR family transcriptional regulator [Microbacterium mangrovi]
MPRLTEESKRRRMEQIADAAMRCFAREGFRDTTMADIIAESGLSAGSIYSHFESKADLLRMVASEVLEARVRGLIGAAAESSEPVSPGVLFERVVGAVFEADRARVLVQVWGEAPNDPELAQIALGKVTQVRELLTASLRPWAGAQGDAGEVRVAALTDVFLTCVQGYAVRRTLDPDVDAAALAARLGAMLDRA